MLAVGSTFRDFFSDWADRQRWHISFIFLLTNRKRKNIKKIKYILTDIHKHQHEGQNKGKEDIISEVKKLKENGYMEVTLLGQNVTTSR